MRDAVLQVEEVAIVLLFVAGCELGEEREVGFFVGAHELRHLVKRQALLEGAEGVLQAVDFHLVLRGHDARIDHLREHLLHMQVGHDHLRAVDLLAGGQAHALGCTSLGDDVLDL